MQAEDYRKVPEVGVTNPTIDVLRAHRTIRKFEDSPLSVQDRDALIDVARRAPTSSFRQQFSIIHVTDVALRDQLAEVAQQPYVGTSKGDLFTRVGESFPRAGKKVVLMRLYLGRSSEGPAATTWIFGSPSDLEEVNRLLGEKYDTQPVSDPAGFAAIEIKHPEFSAGLLEPSQIMDDIFQTLGGHGYEGPAFVEDHFSQQNDANL